MGSMWRDSEGNLCTLDETLDAGWYAYDRIAYLVFMECFNSAPWDVKTVILERLCSDLDHMFKGSREKIEPICRLHGYPK
ncbi:MAG: hypothetical protein C0179_02530 [Fervidicoccus sp.]|nr:MAG: hypothetical protein C0179_02530 [Fervidicoccus sp.]